MRAFFIYTPLALLQLIHRFLSKYNIRNVVELHGVFDFANHYKDYAEELGGYATTKLSSGMHEFMITLDSEGCAIMQAAHCAPPHHHHHHARTHAHHLSPTPYTGPGTPIIKGELDRGWAWLPSLQTFRAWASASSIS